MDNDYNAGWNDYTLDQGWNPPAGGQAFTEYKRGWMDAVKAHAEGQRATPAT